MILVDSSVWVAHLRGHRTPAVARLEAAASREPLLIGDLILLEILEGARDEAHAARIEGALRRYAIAPLLSAARPTACPTPIASRRPVAMCGITSP